MEDSELREVLAFIERAENLKNTRRFAFTSTGKQESSADHSWRLCLMVLLFAKTFPDIHLEKCFKLAIIHDLAEAVCGDTPAIQRERLMHKANREEEAFQELIVPLPQTVQTELADLWNEYNAGKTNEAKLVKALDKLETLIQHNQGINPPDFDYAFNLTYGKDWTRDNNVLARLRQLIDVKTKKHINKV